MGEWGQRIATFVVDDGRFGAPPRIFRDDGRSTLVARSELCVTLFAPRPKVVT
jgi:hypothetical protein